MNSTFELCWLHGHKTE